MAPTIFISAGEASGEHYGALLIEALRQRLAAGRAERQTSSAWADQVWLPPAWSA